MPKNPGENIYVTVTIPRGSWIQQKLAAELGNNTTSLGQILLTRAGDWYRLQESGGTIAAAIPATPTPNIEDTVKRRQRQSEFEMRHQEGATDADLLAIEPD